MDANIISMEDAYQRNNAVDVHGFELRYRNGLAALQLDLAAAKAQEAICDSEVTGP